MVSLPAWLSRLGIRARITLISLGVMALAIGGMAASTDHFLDRELTRAYQLQARAVAKGLKLQLERLLQLGIEVEGLVGFEEQLEQAVRTYADINRAMVVGRHGEILFHSDDPRAGNKVDDPLLLRAFEELEEQVVGHRIGTTEMYSAIHPVFGPTGAYVASVVVTFTTDTIEARSQDMETIGVVLGAIFVALSLATLMLALSETVVVPVRKLMEAVEGIQGAGETFRPIGIKSQDEIGRLAAAFNAMAGRLGTVIQREREAAGARAAALEQAKRSADLENVVRDLERAQDASLNLLEDIDHRRQALEAEIETRKQAEAVVQKTNRVLRVLSAGNAALVQAADEPMLLSKTCQVLVEIGGYRMAWIGFAENDATKGVRVVAHGGHDEGYLDAADITWADTERGRGPTGTAIRTGTVQVNQNMLDNPAMAPWREAALERGYAASIALPLKNHRGIFGALTIYASERDAFDADEVKLLMELADDVAFGIAAMRGRAERDTAVHRLERSMEATVAAIATTVEMRDPYTAGHQRRVADLAAAIAREMGFDEARVRALHLAAVVHDVGKIHIPAEILSKPTRLSAVERQLVQTHAQAGFDILKDVEFPWPIAQMVVQHHERLDGTGYPNGLKGDAILPESRILAVADVVESMMSHRPYRPGLGLDASLDEIEKGKGRIYDAAAVEACAALMRSGRFKFEPH